jgi:hypothetical protein
MPHGPPQLGVGEQRADWQDAGNNSNAAASASRNELHTTTSAWRLAAWVFQDTSW